MKIRKQGKRAYFYYWGIEYYIPTRSLHRRFVLLPTKTLLDRQHPQTGALKRCQLSSLDSTWSIETLARYYHAAIATRVAAQ